MERGLILTSSNLCARPAFCPFRSHCCRRGAQLLSARISLVSGPPRARLKKRRRPRDTQKTHPRANPQESGVRAVCGQVRFPGLNQLH